MRVTWASVQWVRSVSTAGRAHAVRLTAAPKVVVKAAAVEKRQATREARKTMGKKQKKKITGKPEEKKPKGS
jgi:hypothetical protein